MQPAFQRFLIAFVVYFVACVVALLVMTPFSFVNYVGPAAAIASGLIIFWGGPSLFAVLFASPLLVLFQDKYLHLDPNVASTLIATLAIILQSFWAKQLTYKFVIYNKWLKSRQWIFYFLVRLGPLSALVSATAVLVISILDNQVMLGSFFYTFLSTWASSMLVAVFFIPLLLLGRERTNPEINHSKRLFIIFVSILGGLAIVLLLKTSQDEQQSHRLTRFNQEKQSIERSVKQEVDNIVKQVNSLAALFKASDNVDFSEFILFSQTILGDNSSVRALEWAPIVTAKTRPAFEAKVTKELKGKYLIKQKNAYNQLEKAKPRKRYAPLLYVYPIEGNQSVFGLDILTNAKQVLSMDSVAQSAEILASAPMTLMQDNLSRPAVLFSQSIYRSQEPSVIENKKLNLQQVSHPGTLAGFVVAVVQFDLFFEKLSNNQAQNVNFFIQDITQDEPLTLYGDSIPTLKRHMDTIEMTVFSRQWLITVGEKSPWFVQEKNWQTWVMLVGGSFGALVFQLLILMMAAYSVELTLQVNTKTQALNLAKERSEQKSLAKTQFLTTLNDELRTPLDAIQVFLRQFKEKGISNKQVTGINHASNNIIQLLDTMMDISEIESGDGEVRSDAFDFYGFIHRMELMLKANNVATGKSIFFLIDKDVPHFINSDELRIQKLLIAFTKSAQMLFNTNDLRLSIKIHVHQRNKATLFFVYSHQDEATAQDSESAIQAALNKEIASFSTSMAMVKEVCQLLQGNISLGPLTTGGGILSASIRVSVTSPEQQNEHQSQFFDEPH